MLIYLIAGEPSGDMLGARLMRALKEQAPEAEFAGIGGENMEKEGLSSLFDISDLAVMGLAEVIPSIPKILGHIRRTVADIAAKKPDAVITIDSWSFSERIHKALRRQKIATLQMHYVAPQVWAWKKGRAKTMHKYIDRLLTLFPNEPAYFTPHHLATDCVGHPVVENPLLAGAGEDFHAEHGVPADKRLVLILPGSRHNEVSRLLPAFLDSAALLAEQYPDLYFVLPTVKTVEQRVRRMLEAHKGVRVEVLTTQAERYAAAKAAVAAMAASGTVSLELAIMKVPHLIAYRVAPLTAWLARHLLKIRSVNLPNIILNKTVVPELLQEDCNPARIAEVMGRFLAQTDEGRQTCAAFRSEMDELCRLLGVGSVTPSRKAAEIILREIKKRRNGQGGQSAPDNAGETPQ